MSRALKTKAYALLNQAPHWRLNPALTRHSRHGVSAAATFEALLYYR